MAPEDDVPSTPQVAPPTAPSEPHSTDIPTAQFSQLSEILSRQLRTIFGELSQELTQSHQDVTHSYQELRGDIRELTLRVEVLE